MLLKASMIVHRIEDTLLTDELDDDKLMITTKDDKTLLNQYFNNHNLEFFDLKVSITMIGCYVFLLYVNYNLCLNSNLFI